MALCYFLLRISVGIFESTNWVYGKGIGYEGDYEEIMKEIMRFKSLEGTVEAGPQLVLQLYIITRIGLNLDKTEGEN